MVRQQSQSNVKEVEFEAAEQTAPVTLSFHLDLEGLGVSIINQRMQELIYASLRGLSFGYKDTAASQDIIVGCKWIQIDNQL